MRTRAASSPVGFRHALDADGLRAPGVRFFSIWDGDALVGIAALRRLEDAHAEVKSMRTAPGHLRRGIARLALARLIAAARADGHVRLSLETGTSPKSAPANTLYEAAGFVDGEAFGGSPPSPHNRFMTCPSDQEPRCPRSSSSVTASPSGTWRTASPAGGTWT